MESLGLQEVGRRPVRRSGLGDKPSCLLPRRWEHVNKSLIRAIVFIPFSSQLNGLLPSRTALYLQRDGTAVEGPREALNPSQENKNKLAGLSSLVLAPPPSSKLFMPFFERTRTEKSSTWKLGEQSRLRCTTFPPMWRICYQKPFVPFDECGALLLLFQR